MSYGGKGRSSSLLSSMWWGGNTAMLYLIPAEHISWCSRASGLRLLIRSDVCSCRWEDSWCYRDLGLEFLCKTSTILNLGNQTSGVKGPIGYSFCAFVVSPTWETRGQRLPHQSSYGDKLIFSTWAITGLAQKDPLANWGGLELKNIIYFLPQMRCPFSVSPCKWKIIAEQIEQMLQGGITEPSVILGSSCGISS